MSEKEEIALDKRILDNIRKAQRALFERKAKLGEPVVFADENGMPVIVSGEEALKRLDQLCVELS